MFTFARFIVQHKVGAVAVMALAVVFLAPERGEQEGPASPWDAPAPTSNVVAAEEQGVIDDLISEADTLIAESGLDPRAAAEETTGRFDETADRFASANSN